MKKGRYTEEQIAYALRQVELGTPVAEVVRKMGVSEQTFYRWKKQYAGINSAAPAAIPLPRTAPTPAASSRTDRPRNPPSYPAQNVGTAP